MHSAILNETIAGVTDILGPELDGIAVERAVIGLFFTGVKLTSGPNGVQIAGTCATPRDAIPGDICCPVSARAAGFQTLAGRPAAELMQGALAGNGLSRAVGIATLKCARRTMLAPPPASRGRAAAGHRRLRRDRIPQG